jgi:hypothetical protein
MVEEDATGPGRKMLSVAGKTRRASGGQRQALFHEEVTASV